MVYRNGKLNLNVNVKTLQTGNNNYSLLLFDLKKPPMLYLKHSQNRGLKMHYHSCTYIGPFRLGYIHGNDKMI